MRRFRFRLDPLLRVRTQFERAARRDLATAMAEVDRVEQLQRTAAQGVAEFADQAAGNDAVGFLARRLEVSLRQRQWRLAREMAAAEGRLGKARNDYAQRARDLRVLQQLREHKRTEWRIEAARAEQAELDELSQLGRAHAQGGEV